MLPSRTAKYVEAMNREGDNFDYNKWIQGVREEEAEAISFGETMASATGNLTDTPDLRDAWVNSGLVPQAKSTQVPSAVYRLDQKIREKSPQDRLRRRLMRVSDAFDEFQESRVRDAVFKYLAVVFAVVVDHKGRRRTRRLVRRAFQFAGLPFDKNADPFAAVIRCTCERKVDNKSISKWARALRYVAYCKKPRTPLKTFVKTMGGVNGCAERYAKYFGRSSGL